MHPTSEQIPGDIPGTRITIPGKPFAWRRARSNRKIRFKDKATEAHRDSLAAIVKPHFNAPIEGAVRLTVVATFKLPASWSKRKQDALRGKFHTAKPDLGNLVKEFEDGLNRIAWVDDSQIAAYGPCAKVWGDRDETVLVVERVW
jgi:Holliday junction resolvase RusA-like endonuclease